MNFGTNISGLSFFDHEFYGRGSIFSSEHIKITDSYLKLDTNDLTGLNTRIPKPSEVVSDGFYGMEGDYYENYANLTPIGLFESTDYCELYSSSINHPECAQFPSDGIGTLEQETMKNRQDGCYLRTNCNRLVYRGYITTLNGFPYGKKKKRKYRISSPVYSPYINKDMIHTFINNQNMFIINNPHFVHSMGSGFLESGISNGNEVDCICRYGFPDVNMFSSCFDLTSKDIFNNSESGVGFQYYWWLEEPFTYLQYRLIFWGVYENDTLKYYKSVFPCTNIIRDDIYINRSSKSYLNLPLHPSETWIPWETGYDKAAQAKNIPPNQ